MLLCVFFEEKMGPDLSDECCVVTVRVATKSRLKFVGHLTVKDQRAAVSTSEQCSSICRGEITPRAKPFPFFVEASVVVVVTKGIRRARGSVGGFVVFHLILKFLELGPEWILHRIMPVLCLVCIT